MRIIRWMIGALVAVSVPMIALLVYDAAARDGGSGSWIMAGIWFIATVLIVGNVTRSMRKSRAATPGFP